MKSNALKIVGEEFKKAGIDMAEEVLEKAVEVLFEKALPRVAVEDDNAIAKSLSGVVMLAYPALKPAIAKATDINHDGQ